MFLAITIFGQNNFEPQILVLSPYETKYEKSFEKEIISFNNSLKSKINEKLDKNSDVLFASEEFENQPENLKIYTKSLIDFQKDSDFFKQTSVLTSDFLLYRFVERFPNVLVKLSPEKISGKPEDFKKLYEEHKLQYVVNFKKIEFYKEKGKKYADIELQLFDDNKNAVVIEQSYKGELYNQGFEFSCDGKSLQCCINNAMSKAIDDIVREIAINNPALKNQRNLSETRFQILEEEYFNKKFDKNFVEKIVNEKDVETKDIFQLLKNEDETKFVAFFLKQSNAKGFGELTKNNNDKNVKIFTDKKITDKNYLNDKPSNYAYIVEGVKYNDKWFYRKSNVTYFNSKDLKDGQLSYFNNLQGLNFFKDNSTDFNSDFWETQLFAKVEDLTKNKDWKKYGEGMWETEEINNRDYIGFYEIVADRLRGENNIENEKFENEKTDDVFKPYYENLIKDKVITKFSNHSVILPKTRNIALNPVLFTNKKGEKIIHYFVDYEGGLYEWNYLSPKTIKNDLEFGLNVVDDLGKLTKWNFSVDNLNDENFWNNYVLKKSEEHFIYLKKVR